MSAVEVLPWTAPRAEWLAARMAGIGGSDAPAILAMSRWNSPRDIYLDKTGRKSLDTVSWPIMVGNALEGPLLQWFSLQTGIGHTRVGLLRSTEKPWMQVSLDAYTDDGGIAECKSVGFRMADDWDDDQVADHAELQAQWGMAVTGRSHAWVIAAIGGADPVFRRIERDQSLIDMMTDKLEKFWHDNVLADVEPPLIAIDLEPLREEWSTVEHESAIGGQAEAEAIERRQAAAANVKLWTTIQQQAEAEIVKALANAEQLVIDGAIWATRKSQTSRVVDRELLADAGIDVDDYRTERTTRVLRIPTPKSRKVLSPNG